MEEVDEVTSVKFSQVIVMHSNLKWSDIKMAGVSWVISGIKTPDTW